MMKNITAILFLDDERNPEDVTWVNYPENSVFTVVRTFEEFCVAVSLNDYDKYSFDHDIQDFHTIPKGGSVFNPIFGEIEVNEEIEYEYKGTHCLEFLLSKRSDLGVDAIIIHTQNPTGRENMLIAKKNMEK